MSVTRGECDARPMEKFNLYTGWDKFAIFDGNYHLSRKRYEIGARCRPIPVIANRKSLAADRSVSAAIISSDLF